MKNPPKWPVTIFYDKACNICRSLVKGYKQQDSHNRLHLIDISSPKFDAGRYGLDPKLVQIYLYAQDATGRTVRGVDSFVWIWHAIGKNASASLLSWPIVRIIAQPIYRLFSRYRYAFNKRKRAQRKQCKGACKWQQL